MERKEAFDYIMHGKGSIESFYKMHHYVDDDNWEEGQKTIIKETGCDENTARWVWADIKKELCHNESDQNSTQPTRHLPTCPTCGSTNVQKISGTKRWLTTGLFGLASSDVGKTMKCKNCGYKW